MEHHGEVILVGAPEQLLVRNFGVRVCQGPRVNHTPECKKVEVAGRPGAHVYRSRAVGGKWRLLEDSVEWLTDVGGSRHRWEKQTFKRIEHILKNLFKQEFSLTQKQSKPTWSGRSFRTKRCGQSHLQQLQLLPVKSVVKVTVLHCMVQSESDLTFFNLYFSRKPGRWDQNRIHYPQKCNQNTVKEENRFIGEWN